MCTAPRRISAQERAPVCPAVACPEGRHTCGLGISEKVAPVAARRPRPIEPVLLLARLTRVSGDVSNNPNHTDQRITRSVYRAGCSRWRPFSPANRDCGSCSVASRFSAIMRLMRLLRFRSVSFICSRFSNLYCLCCSLCFAFHSLLFLALLGELLRTIHASYLAKSPRIVWP